ncbi:MAG: hypothetical protein HYY18_09845 [Planctomycetes bacterium]|nr:hypothetical protein [Planctomycetota bacterium]
MPERRSFRARLNARLTRWESVLGLVFLVDLFEDRWLFPNPEIPPWAKIALKMACIVGLLGILLHFVNRRIEGTLSVTRGVSDRLIVPRIAMHALLLGAVFVGYYWLKIGRTPWA